MEWEHSKFMQGRNIKPLHFKTKMDISSLIDNYEKSSFEARNVAAGAKLFESMINNNDTIWLGISGAIILGGFGGYVIDLMKKGFVDVICSTGAQVYHDLHFAFNLPVRQGSAFVNDNELKKDGTTRVYDINIREKETLIAQDNIITDFGRRCKLKGNFSSADFNFELGNYVLENAPNPELSWVVQAAKLKVPIFWDSLANHSIGMSLAKLYIEGKDINPNPSLDILESASILYSTKTNGFFELGGGGPKNFIQQMGPTISQILNIDFEGADRGVQITTAIEKDGGLSGCTFGEAVTWGKYKDATKGLVQVWGEVSVVAPLIFWYAMENCKVRTLKKLMERKTEFFDKLVNDSKVHSLTKV
ncbi:deoxyhypusine synthase family protein [Candidatus Woesearchaeota archaeon]|nr:deoxyhypusine synthase family protein [Candidatus Woesearchaeota archaeon]